MIRPPNDMLGLLPPEAIQRHRIVPLALEGTTLQIGVVETPTATLLRDLAFLTGKTIVPVKVDRAEIDAFLEEHVSGVPEGIAPMRDVVRGIEVRDYEAGHQTPTAEVRILLQGSVVQQVNTLIERAITKQASDIHIEPYEASYRVRFRLDGVLNTTAEISLLQRDALISRLKIMASLDIAEKRRPQDGRIRYQHAGRTIDLRVSSLPTDFGEKLVLRLLDKSHLKLELGALGFEAADLHTFREAIHQPYGIILVSGPTGSGKTTTLYAALNELNTDAVNITTIEDPIEYNLPGINQTHVRADIGFTFAQALRAFLRQDPNIIMVGEIRDRETAEIAIRAALTGHLVLSTIHTNDAPSTITRLIEMGVEPFLVASSLRLAVAQRLVRCICVRCREEAEPDPALLQALPLHDGGPVYRGRGCAACQGTGYQGRTALFEVLPVSAMTAELIVQRVPIHALRQQAREEGLPSLRMAAIKKMQTGITTPEEVLRETSL